MKPDEKPHYPPPTETKIREKWDPNGSGMQVIDGHLVVGFPKGGEITLDGDRVIIKRPV